MTVGFKLFDTVQLRDPVELDPQSGNALEPLTLAPSGTIGSVVEVLEPEKVYLVELFGDWIQPTELGSWQRAQSTDPKAVRETLGVGVVLTYQMKRLKPQVLFQQAR